MLHSLYITAEKCQIYFTLPMFLKTVDYLYCALSSLPKNARRENFSPFLAAVREV